MSSVHATIDAGVCGFVTTVRATCGQDFDVRLELETPCGNIRSFAEALPDTVNALSEIKAGWNGVILTTARERAKSCCSGCVVPNGVFKAMQIAADLALPRDAALKFDRTEEPA